MVDWSLWLAVLEVAVGLGMVIFAHELGHFAVAKMCGVKCEKFYLGFDIAGLKLCKFTWGETEYGIGCAWYYDPLASECDTWTQATLTFHAGDLTCTRTVYKKLN